MGKKYQWGVDNQYKLVLSRQHPFFNENEPVHKEFNPYFDHLASFYSPPFMVKKTKDDYRAVYSRMKAYARQKMREAGQESSIVRFRLYNNQTNELICVEDVN